MTEAEQPGWVALPDQDTFGAKPFDRTDNYKRGDIVVLPNNDLWLATADIPASAILPGRWFQHRLGRSDRTRHGSDRPEVWVEDTAGATPPTHHPSNVHPNGVSGIASRMEHDGTDQRLHALPEVDTRQSEVNNVHPVGEP